MQTYLHLALSLIFGCLSQSSPLFSNNQNAYLVHAVRATPYGSVLKDDWLANSANVLPLFTWLSAISLRLSPWLLYFYTILLNSAGFYALMLILDWLLNIPGHESHLKPRWLTAMLVFIAMSVDLLDIPFFSQGLAYQYLFSWYFQPSSFGVLLLCSVAALCRGSAPWTVWWAGCASAFHPTYLLSTVSLTLCALLLDPKRNLRRTLLLLGITFGLAGPSLYLGLVATHSSDYVTQVANLILVNHRIPHHAKPNVWFNYKFALQMLWMVVAAWIVRTRKPLNLVYAIALGIGTTLSVLALLTRSAALLLLFPWRLSTWLVPLSTTVIAYQLSLWTVSKPRVAYAVCILTLLGTMVLVPKLVASNLERRKQPSSAVNLVRQIPKSQRNTSTFLIPPWDKQGIQLNAPARVFVTHKAHPYKPDEVIEWWERLQLAKRFYKSHGKSLCKVLHKIHDRESTLKYVVMPSHRSLHCSKVTPLGRNNHFTLYDLHGF